MQKLAGVNHRQGPSSFCYDVKVPLCRARTLVLPGPLVTLVTGFSLRSEPAVPDQSPVRIPPSATSHKTYFAKATQDVAGALDNKKMPLYEADSRLADDRCAILNRLRDNQSLVEYRLFDPFARGATLEQCRARQAKLRDFAADQASLRYVDGYGVAPCDIDGDSRLRRQTDSARNARERQTLRKRVFGAAPDRSRGLPRPTAESMLVFGQDTARDRQCQHAAEATWDRFHPCVDVQHATPIPDDPLTGVSSRDIARSREFLRAIGYDDDDDDVE